MLYERINLFENDESVYLEVFAAEKVGTFVRRAILVLPGGGYSDVCVSREGEPIALSFMPFGYNAFVLHYSAGKKAFPAHLIEASLAIKYIKDNAEKYNINPKEVFAVGFSAGGHLAATLGTMWDRREIYDVIDMPFGYNKPKGVMLIYPVISAKYHMFSFNNLLQDKEPTQESLDMCSAENSVSENTCPAYILHTSNDDVVDVRNSLTFANSLAQNKIKFEMHIYPDAPHGLALGNEITECGVEKWNNPSIAKWVENAAVWAKSLDD